MNRKAFTAAIYIVLLFSVSSLMINWLTDTTTAQTATPVFEVPVCKEHGGVNCSIINPDASIVCNDGTIDDSFIIYGIPECRETIEAIEEQQSSFMIESGCGPPSEMACINEQSYQSLYSVLNVSGLATSELGKSELAQCRQQIGEYAVKNKDYKLCLLENNNPEFTLPSGIFVKPLLKAIFCPIFYGDNSSYDDNADLCICDSGYFMSNEKCEKASLICHSKYGPASSAQNGNCQCKEGYRLNPGGTQCILSVQSSTEPITTSLPSQIIRQNTAKQTPSEITQTSDNNPPGLNVIPRLTPNFSPSDQAQTTENLAQRPSLITKIFTALMSGIKNIAKLW